MMDKGIKIIDDTGKVVSEQLVRREFDNKITDKIDKRSIIFILCKNDAATILLYLRCISEKIVPVMISGMVKPQELIKMVKDYKPSYIWIEKTRANEIEGALVLGEYDEYYLLKTMNYKAYEINDELALLLPTSGSTGSSKLVRLSYKNIECNTNAIIKSLNIQENDVAPLVLPISYTYALSIINTYHKVGATVVITNYKIYMDEFWKTMNRSLITSFSGVPYTYEMLIRFGLLNRFPDTIRVMTVAGGLLDSYYLKKVYETASNNNIKFFVMYGQTEATARISIMKVDDTRLQGGCIGKVLEGLDYQINDDGELIIYGDSVSLGYATSYKDLLKGDDNKGILHTNDIVREKDNYLYWEGRKDRSAKIYGNRVDFTQLERKIKDRFPGHECVCKQFKDNEITIFTDWNDGMEVIEYIASITELNKLILNVKIVKEFPRKENGKIEYGGLKYEEN